jgi:hypothetical protein
VPLVRRLRRELLVLMLLVGVLLVVCLGLDRRLICRWE